MVDGVGGWRSRGLAAVASLRDVLRTVGGPG